MHPKIITTAILGLGLSLLPRTAATVPTLAPVLRRGTPTSHHLARNNKDKNPDFEPHPRQFSGGDEIGELPPMAHTPPSPLASPVPKQSQECGYPWIFDYALYFCDEFYITFGQKRDNLSWAWWNKNEAILRGKDWDYEDVLRCDGDRWTSIKTNYLPWTVEVHSGKACDWVDDPEHDYDDLWIKYANQWIDVPRDCLKVGENNETRHCKLKIWP